MNKLPEKVSDSQVACESARALIKDNVDVYREYLRAIISLSLADFEYELPTFSQISHYLSIPKMDIFNYEDWIKFLRKFLMECESTYVCGRNKSRLKSLKSEINGLMGIGESLQYFKSILAEREEVIDGFLESEYLLDATMSYGLMDEDSLKSVWSTYQLDAEKDA